MADHYFHTPDGPIRTREVTTTIFGHDLSFTTANGVYSGAGLDPGTAILLRESAPPTSGRILDLGCGWGPIAIGLAVASKQVRVDAVDVNERALELCRLNAERAGVAERVRAMLPDQVADTATYDEIWSNPPIRIGKPALHELLLHWLPRLAPTGSARLVVGKNLGADSLQRWLIDQGYPAERTASAKGFRVIRVLPGG
ncbi:class I SAM-dependent methyltransferase [Naumannella halotolerans]|uniref:class I SAM-dependent methyltransferase n=1 Tax=Naumannella halotolerans TaxID=993414 RepID=UPI00370D5574